MQKKICVLKSEDKVISNKTLWTSDFSWTNSEYEGITLLRNVGSQGITSQTIPPLYEQPISHLHLTCTAVSSTENRASLTNDVTLGYAIVPVVSACQVVWLGFYVIT